MSCRCVSGRCKNLLSSVAEFGGEIDIYDADFQVLEEVSIDEVAYLSR